MAKITIEIDDADLWSEIFGSGFGSYPWWGDVVWVRGDWEKPGVSYLQLIDPDTQDGEVVAAHHIALNDIEAAISTVLQKYPYYNIFDIDAELADMILQTAVAGRVIFG